MIHTHMNIYQNIYIHIYVYIYTHRATYVDIFIHAHTRPHTHTRTHTHTYIYIHTRKHTNKYVEYDIIIKGKSYTFKNAEKKFKITNDLSCKSKKLIYIIECSKCKEIYIGSTKAIHTRISFHMNNISISENRKLNVSKHQFECSQGEFKMMSIYQTNDYTLL